MSFNSSYTIEDKLPANSRIIGSDIFKDRDLKQKNYDNQIIIKRLTGFSKIICKDLLVDSGYANFTLNSPLFTGDLHFNVINYDRIMNQKIGGSD